MMWKNMLWKDLIVRTAGREFDTMDAYILWLGRRCRVLNENATNAFSLVTHLIENTK